MDPGALGGTDCPQPAITPLELKASGAVPELEVRLYRQLVMLDEFTLDNILPGHKCRPGDKESVWSRDSPRCHFADRVSVQSHRDKAASRGWLRSQEIERQP